MSSSFFSRPRIVLFLAFAIVLRPTTGLRAASGRALAPRGRLWPRLGALAPQEPNGGGADTTIGLVRPPDGLQPSATGSGSAYPSANRDRHIGAPAHFPAVRETVAFAGHPTGNASLAPSQTGPLRPRLFFAPAQTGPPKPRLFFLFLVYDKINNEDIWNRFFATAVQGFDYRAFVHCKTEGACSMNIKQHDRYEVIPSVETTYCFDLVGGMNALLTAALERGGGSHPSDKFILVSDSTLPVKPFSFIQQQLTQDTGSDFCIFPRNEWAEVQVVENIPGQPVATTVKRVAVKHHQWAVLSREHAQMAVRKSGELQDLMHRFQLNTPGSKNTGCLDEFWHFAVLFGSLKLGDSPTILGLPALNGDRVSTVNYEIQGQCDTFVNWVARASGSNNNMTRLTEELMADPGTDMDQASDTRPSTFHRVSKKSLASLRSSPFLFARKIDDGCTFAGCDSVAEAFDRLVFSTPSRPLDYAPLWLGQGPWVDTRGVLVNIVAADGAVRVIGSSVDMNAKGGYCKSHMSVLFTTGFRVEATLSPDGMQLQWTNGAVWWRQGSKPAL